MKTLFIESRKRILLEKIDLSLIPEKIFIAYSIQYKPLALNLRKRLGKRVKGFKQVLGCSKLKTNYPLLLIGSGRFHALNLALQNKQVYVLEEDKINKIEEKDIESIKKKKKSTLSMFFSSNNIGILVSLKPGQKNMKEVIKLRDKLQKQGKKPWIFLADNISLTDLENYPIESWVNTSCPGISYDANSRFLNLEDLKI